MAQGIERGAVYAQVVTRPAPAAIASAPGGRNREAGPRSAPLEPTSISYQEAPFVSTKPQGRQDELEDVRDLPLEETQAEQVKGGADSTTNPPPKTIDLQLAR